MTEYRVDCNATSHDDYMTAWRDGCDVYIRACKGGALASSVYADTEAARTFARGILALADEIDGGETEASLADRERELLAKPAPVKVGTRVRVLEASWLPEATGELGTVCAPTDQPGRIRVRMDRPGVCAVGDQLYADRWEILDAPADEPTDTSAPTRGAQLVTQAKALLAGTDHTASDVVALARFLASE